MFRTQVDIDVCEKAEEMTGKFVVRFDSQSPNVRINAPLLSVRALLGENNLDRKSTGIPETMKILRSSLGEFVGP